MKVGETLVVVSKIIIVGCLFEYAKVWGEAKYNKGYHDACKDLYNELNKVRAEYGEGKKES